MRLRLTVQRHGLPPTQVLWMVGGLHSSYAAAGANATISQMLEQVNEILPLESEDWGIEDYAVEVRGFECLHFSELSQILKEDDEVSIRPLQTSDLRFRRLSGRHQISSDGKHLIDGVAFGRPYLRRGDRPGIKIPPRKRRRLTHNDDEDLSAGEHSNDRQIVLRAGFDDADNENQDDSEDDEEYDPDEDDSALDEELKEISEELQALVEEGEQQYLDGTERTMHLDGVGDLSGRLTRSQEKMRGLGLRGSTILELRDENGRRYPGEYYNPLLDYYDRADLVPSRDINRKRDRRKVQRQMPRAGAMTSAMSANPRRESRRSSSASTKNVRFKDREPRPQGTIPANEDMDDSGDEDFQPHDVIDSGSDGSDKENAEPDMVDSESSEISLSSDEPSSTISSDSGIIDSETSSSLSSTSSSSSSESEAELSVEKQEPNLKLHITDTPTNKTAPVENAVSVPPDPPMDSVRHVPSGQGRKETRKRNQRRRDNKKLVYLKAIGVLASTATLADFKQWNASHQATGQAQKDEEPSLKQSDTNTAFEVTRLALLDSPASGGTEIEPSRAEAQKQSHRAKSVYESTTQDVQESKDTNTQAAAQSQNDTQGAASEPPRRRAKLDLASSKRLLFGSLGLRPPKTKDDEDSLREKLMRNVTPINNPPNDRIDKAVPNHGEDDDSWEKKIILKAVECCHDGIELSTPPFPFVQRWDPQQQGHYNNRNGQGGKSKKRKRNKQHYEDEEQAQNGESDAANVHLAEVLAGHEVNHKEPSNHDNEQGVQRADGATNNQLMRDAKGISTTAPDDFSGAEDLPTLPDDMSVCKVLVPAEALPGTIFAFKQLDMSQDTNWQPKISDYRTATLNEVMDDGVLQITLAQRDRSDKEKAYDQETGKRLYAKFEMPEYEDADVDIDAGVFEISFADLIEPKLVRAANTQHIPDDEEQKTLDGNVVEARDGDVPIPEVFQALVSRLNDVTAEEAHDVLHRSEPHDISEDAEKEIVKIIRESGFDSDVADGVKVGQGFPPHDNQINHVSEGHDDPLSAGFNGFSSSPPVETKRMQLPSIRDGLHDTSLGPWQSSVRGSGDVDPGQFDSPSPDGDSLTGAVIDEDVLPQLEIDDGGLPCHAPGAAPEEAEHQFPSQELPTPSSPPRTASIASRSKVRGLRSPINRQPISALDGAGSDPADFPTLETVYSARTGTVKPPIDNAVNNPESPQEVPPRRLRSGDTAAASYTAGNAIESPSPAFESLVTASQAPTGSQIVDLTLSSDPVDPDGSEYEDGGSELPGEPGWVEKRKTRAANAESKRSIGRSKRTRSTV